MPESRGQTFSAAIASLGAPCRAQAVQVASRFVVIHSSGSIARPQKVSLICGLATCTTPAPFACFRFISLLLSSVGADPRYPVFRPQALWLEVRQPRGRSRRGPGQGTGFSGTVPEFYPHRGDATSHGNRGCTRALAGVADPNVSRSYAFIASPDVPRPCDAPFASPGGCGEGRAAAAGAYASWLLRLGRSFVRMGIFYLRLAWGYPRVRARRARAYSGAGRVREGALLGGSGGQGGLWRSGREWRAGSGWWSGGGWGGAGARGPGRPR